MVLSDEEIAKFQALYKKEFGVEITREDAYEQGVKLLKLVSIVYKPMTDEEYELVKKDNEEVSLLQEKQPINQYESIKNYNQRIPIRERYSFP